MNKLMLLALAMLAISAMAQTSSKLIHYQDFEIPSSATQILLTSNTDLSKSTIGYVDGNDVYIQFIGYNHVANTITLTSVQNSAGQIKPALQIPTISLNNMQNPSGQSIDIVAKKYTHGSGIADYGGEVQLCPSGQFQVRLNSLTIKCTWAAIPFTDAAFDPPSSRGWKQNMVANVKWAVVEGAFGNDPASYATSQALSESSAIGAAAKDLSSAKFFSADTTTQAQLLIDAAGSLAATTTFQFKFKKNTSRKHFLMTIGLTNNNNYDTLHCYKERNIWYVANTVMTAADDSNLLMYRAPTVAMVRIDQSSTDVIIEFRKTFANTDDLNSKVPGSSTNVDREVIIFAKDSLIKNDNEFIKIHHTLSLVAADKNSAVGVSVPSTLAASLGSVEINDGTNSVKLRYQFFKGKKVSTANDYDHLLISAFIPAGYETYSWVGFGMKQSSSIGDLRIASRPNSVTHVFTNYGDYVVNLFRENLRDFSDILEGSQDGMIVGSTVTSTTMEATFYIAVTSSGDVDLSAAHTTAEKFFVFGQKVANSEYATKRRGKVSQAITASFTITLAPNEDYYQYKSIDVTKYSNLQQIGSANAKIGQSSSTVTFDGKFTYLTSADVETNTAADTNKILFALTFKNTAAAIPGGIVGLSFGKALGADAHYYTVSSKTFQDGKITTAVTTDGNNAFTAGAYGTDASNANADDVTLLGSYMKTVGNENTVFLLYERISKKNTNNNDDQEFTTAAIGTGDVNVADVFAFYTDSLTTLNGAVSTPGQVNFKIDPSVINTQPSTPNNNNNNQTPTLTLPSKKAINNVEGVTVSYQFVKSLSDNSAITKISDLESTGLTELYVNLLDDSAAYDKYTIVALSSTTNNEYEGVLITNTDGNVEKVRITTSGSGSTMAISNIVSSTATTFDNTNTVVDTQNKLVKLYATKAAFGYDSSTKDLKEAKGIVVTTEDPSARTSANTKGPVEFTFTASLASAGIIAKATLMIVAVLFLYFC